MFSAVQSRPHLHRKQPVIFYRAKTMNGSAGHTLGTLSVFSWHNIFMKCPEVVAYAFNPSSWKAEAGGSLRVQGQTGLQELVPGQAPKLHRNPISKKKN